MTAYDYCGSPLFAGNLPESSVCNCAVAYNDILRVLAGNTRMLIEHARGSAAPDVEPVAPINPHGYTGEDHSGAGFGAQIDHTIYSWSACPVPDAIGGVRTPPTLYNATGAYTCYDAVHHVFIPNCYPGGNYESFSVNALIFVYAAPTVSTNVIVDIFPNVDDTYYQTITLATGTANTTYVDESITVKFTPGRVAYMRVKFRSTEAATMVVHLVGLEISV